MCDDFEKLYYFMHVKKVAIQVVTLCVYSQWKISIYNTSYMYTVYDRGLINKHSNVLWHPTLLIIMLYRHRGSGREGGVRYSMHILCIWSNSMIVNILQQMLIISLSSFRPLTGWDLHRFLRKAQRVKARPFD